MISICFQGHSLGLAYVAPIGMQNLFVINSAMSQKLRCAIATALIVIFWDISLALACFLGVGALMEALPWLQKIIPGCGGLLVIYIGVGLVRSKADLSGGKDVNQPLWKIVGSAFIVTWLNRICGRFACYHAADTWFSFSTWTFKRCGTQGSFLSGH